MFLSENRIGLTKKWSGLRRNINLVTPSLEIFCPQASHVAKQLATSAPKNIPDWVLLQTFLGIFRCSKDKMAVHFYLKTLLDHSLSPVRNKINISLGMEANTQRFCYNRRNLS